MAARAGARVTVPETLPLPPAAGELDASETSDGDPGRFPFARASAIPLRVDWAIGDSGGTTARIRSQYLIALS